MTFPTPNPGPKHVGDLRAHCNNPSPWHEFSSHESHLDAAVEGLVCVLINLKYQNKCWSISYYLSKFIPERI